jgi:hypothetical protein
MGGLFLPFFPPPSVVLLVFFNRVAFFPSLVIALWFVLANEIAVFPKSNFSPFSLRRQERRGQGVRQHRYDEAIEYHKKCLEIAQQTGRNRPIRAKYFEKSNLACFVLQPTRSVWLMHMETSATLCSPWGSLKNPLSICKRLSRSRSRLVCVSHSDRSTLKSLILAHFSIR